MFDIDEIMKQTRQAKEQALASMKETMEKTKNELAKSRFPVLKKAHLYLPPKWKNRLPLILNVK